MKTNNNLSTAEFRLCVLVIFVISVSVIFCFLLALILNQRPNFIFTCKCENHLLSIKHAECIPTFFYNRGSHLNYSKQLSRACRQIKHYPYLASLSIIDGNTTKFVCSGTILSKDWVSIGKECGLSANNLKSIRLRAGSSYWSEGGTQHKLTRIDVFHEDGPFAVQVFPPLIFDEYTRSVGFFQNSTYAKFRTAVTAGWRKGVDERERFFINSWTTTPCPESRCKSGEIAESVPCDRKVFGRALVSDSGILIAYHEGLCKYQTELRYVFKDFRNEKYQKWFQILIDGNISVQSYKDEKIVQIYEINECVVPKFLNYTM